MTSAQLSDSTKRVRERLAAARKSIGGRGFEWYPYDSLANLLNLERAFGARYLQALDAAGGKLVADIGCGDGDLAFFLESLGCTVDAIDFPDSNHNGMRAIRALKQHLGSGIEIAEVDLDSQFKLPRRHYDLAVFLGILYHLKNPLYVMEHLAMHTRYCVLSTRVARYFPDDKPMPQGKPVAYLVGEDELNRDASNFWIFSHPGLKRLLERTYWKILDYASTGDTRFSTPVGPKRDERVFCLLESRYGLANVDLLQGWHQAEAGGRRWTMKKFSARINLVTSAGPDRILLRAYLPEDLLKRLGPRRLEIAIDGVPCAPAVLDRPGYHDIARRFRSHGNRSILVSFELDNALPPDEQDQRERALVAVSLDIT
jgi:tRNA (mo5U34)-methyltransferase